MNSVNVFQIGLELSKEEKAELISKLGGGNVSFLTLVRCPETMPPGSCKCWNLMYMVAPQLARRHRFTPVPHGELTHVGDPNLAADEFTLVVFIGEKGVRVRGGMISQTLAWLEKAKTAKVPNGGDQWGYRQPNGEVTTHPWGNARLPRQQRVTAKIAMVAAG